MNWLRKMMYGRYGVDAFSVGLLILSVIITLVSRLLDLDFIYFFSYIPLAFYVYRVFSKDIYHRQQENAMFLKYMYPITYWFKKKWKYLMECRTHHHYTCPKCKQKLRVPRGKGKIEVTCPKCFHHFDKRS